MMQVQDPIFATVFGDGLADTSAASIAVGF